MTVILRSSKVATTFHRVFSFRLAPEEGKIVVGFYDKNGLERHMTLPEPEVDEIEIHKE